MTARRSISRKTWAVLTALMVFSALVVPLIGTANANHPGGSTLEVLEETDSNPTGFTHTLTAQLYQNTTSTPQTVPTGLPVNIDFEVESGPAVRANCSNATPTCIGGTTSDADNSPTSPDLTCEIPAGVSASTCSVVFTSDSNGANVVRAWVDEDRTNTTPEADASEGRYSGGVDDDPGPATLDCRGFTENGTNLCDVGTAVPGATTEPDTTDLVSKTWTQAVAAACLDAEPESKTNPSGSDHVITAKATSSAAAITDVTGTFECTGSALAAKTVDITLTEGPDIFIKAVNGVSTGGPVSGGPNTASGNTDAAGQVTVTIACVSGAPANCTGTNDVTLAVQGAASGSSADTVSKTWAPAGAAVTFNASPETATNEVGQTHAITCASTDNFGGGVAGTNCDAQVSSGPNSDNNIGADANTTNGYVGQCTTAANGTCTISYTSSEVGPDTIQVFNDVNGNDLQAAPENDYTAPGTTADEITKTWVAVGGGTADVDIDMKNADYLPTDGGADCNDLGSGTDDTSDDSTATNVVSGTVGHVVCAERFGPTGVGQAGTVTYTMTGVGQFFADADGDGTFATGDTLLGQGPITVEEGTTGCPAGFNCAYITSTQTGTSTVTATANAQSATGTKTWTNVLQNARNIALDAPAEAEPGTLAQAEALVTDVFGNPVPGVAVTLSETGPAVVTSANPATTGIDGVAQFIYESGTVGTSNLTASIDAGATDCERLANDPVGSTAGNCTDSAVTLWKDVVPVETDHARTAHLNRFKHINLGGGRRSLKVSGTLSTDDGFDACSADQPIKVQIRAGGEWITRKSDTTNLNGRFKVLIADIAKKYRAVAPRTQFVNDDGTIDNCLRAVSNVRRHRH